MVRLVRGRAELERNASVRERVESEMDLFRIRSCTVADDCQR